MKRPTKRRTVSFAALAAAVLGAASCDPHIGPVTTPPVEFHSALPGKIPGHYVLSLDPTTVAVDRTVASATSVCAEEKFPFRPAPALQKALESGLRIVFEDVSSGAPSATPDLTSPAPGSGVVLAWLETFTPKLTCDVDFWGRSCTATVSLTLGIEVRGPYGPAISFTTASSESAEGGAGGACQDVPAILGEAYGLALRDVVHTTLEQLSATEALRGAATR